MTRDRKTTSISVNSEITVNVYLPASPQHSNTQDISAKIRFNFGATKTEFQSVLDIELEKLKEKILISTGFQQLPADIDSEVTSHENN